MNGEKAFEHGKEFYKQKEYSKAIECLKEALEDNNFDKRGKAWYNMGMAYGNLKKYENAIDCYNKAIEAENYATPGNAWHNMGIAYGNLEKYEKAIDCYKEAIEDEKFDTPGNAWYNMGVSYDGLEKYEKAIDCYKEALEDENYATPGKALNNRGVAYGNLEKYEKAIDCFEKSLEDENYATPGRAWYNTGAAYWNLGKYEKAIDCFEKSLEDKNYAIPDHAWNTMGTAYSNLGKYEKAIDCYKRAIRCDPGDAIAYNNLGESLYKLKKPVDAQAQFGEAIRIKSELAEPHYNLGNILTDEECYEAAKKEYETAVLKSESENADYLNSLGYALAKLRRCDDAKKEFKKAIQCDPAHIKAHRNLMLLKKRSEMKYKLPTLLQYGLIVAITTVTITAHFLFYNNILSGTEFVALVVFLVGLLTAIILFPEYKHFKVSPSGVEFSRDTEGKPIESKLAGFMPSHKS
jgi:tetratricopeptide (TPR) repeat protein